MYFTASALARLRALEKVSCSLSLSLLFPPTYSFSLSPFSTLIYGAFMKQFSDAKLFAINFNVALRMVHLNASCFSFVSTRRISLPPVNATMNSLTLTLHLSTFLYFSTKLFPSNQNLFTSKFFTDTFFQKKIKAF